MGIYRDEKKINAWYQQGPHKVFFQCTEKHVETFNNALPVICRGIFAKGPPRS